MLYQISLPFTSQKGLRYGWSSASLLHGVLMEHIPTEYAQTLHSQTVRPLSQSVQDGEKPAWVITTLNADAYQQVIPPLLALRSAEITHREDVLMFGTPAIRRTDYDELFTRHYIHETSARLLQIDFLTPTAFKSAGEYINMPTPRLILMGLARRYDALCDVHDTLYENLAEEIGARVSISSYRLRSTSFPLEGVRIPAFLGSVTLRIRGNETFLHYVNMLGEFGTYSGVGIKTALGMGRIQCTPCR